MHHDFFRKPEWRGYALALAAWAIAFALRYGLAHWFPPGFPYLTFFPAVVLVAYYAGVRPAILAATLSGLAAWWFWIGPTGFDFGTATLVAVAFYVFVVAVDIFFIVGMHGASQRLALEVERSRALAESRDVLLKEVQHRVSNNVQVVSALLSIEARGTTDAEARKALTDAAARTALIARIQRSLAEAGQQTTAFETIAQAVAADALTAAARPDVSLAVSGEGVVLSAEEATPVVLVMLECINNALEHAFPDRAGRIDISLSDIGGERTLLVTDDGVGVSREAISDGSLGLRIIAALSRQLGGAFNLNPAIRGSIARLVWPSPTQAR